MDASWAGPIDWVESFGGRVRQWAEEEAPDSLVEFQVDEEERGELLRQVGRLPLDHVDTRRTRPAVAVAAVQAAVEAESGDEAFRNYFFERIGRSFNQAEWERHYGAAIESFLNEAFGELARRGSGRYVHAVYRHAGVPLPGIRAYAFFLDQLLSLGPAFTRAEYHRLAERVTSSLIRYFLSTNAGFQFSRSTILFLRRHAQGGWDLPALERLGGYRPGFWKELRHHLTVTGTGPSRPPDPVLALDTEQWYLVARFDREWQQRGAYLVDRRRVPYPQQRVAGTAALKYSVAGINKELRPWWGPGVSRAAIFRAGDGVLLAPLAPGGDQELRLRGGDYYVVAEESMGSAFAALGAQSTGWLEVLPEDEEKPPYTIWRVELDGNRQYPDLGIRTVGAERLPSFSLDPEAAPVPGFGANVFRGTAPRLQLVNWSNGTSSRFAIRMRVGGVEREVLPPGDSQWLSLPVEAPCQGRVWIEPRGHSGAGDLLPSIDFTLLPASVRVEVEERRIGPEDAVHVRVEAPNGWTLVPASGRARQVDGQRWELLGDDGLFEGRLTGPGLDLAVSIRLPVVQIVPRSGNRLIWLEQLEGGTEMWCDVSGPPAAFVEFLGDDGGQAALSPLGPAIPLDERGSARRSLRSHVDAMAAHNAAAIELVLRSSGREFRQNRWVLSADSLASLVTPIGDVDRDPAQVQHIGSVPELGDGLRHVMELSTHAGSGAAVVKVLERIGRTPLPEEQRGSLRRAVLENVALAAAIDGAAHDLGSVDAWRAEIPAVQSLIDWLEERAAPPTPFPSVRIQRWRDTIERAREFRDEESAAAELVAEWREALRSGAHCGIQDREGGSTLTAAARSYMQACRNPKSQLRNQALSYVVGNAARAQKEAKAGGIVSSLAFILEQLALLRSGHSVSPSLQADSSGPAVLRRALWELGLLAGVATPGAAPPGLRLSDVSPSDADVFDHKDER